MNIYSLIKKDHDQARDLMEDIMKAKDDPDECIEMIQELKVAILAHAKSEEKTFYEAIKDSGDEQLSDRVPEFRKEHREVEEMFAEIENMDPEDQLWWEKFGEIRQALHHHMEEEEKQVFREAKQDIPKEEAKELGHEMEMLEERLKDRLQSQAA